jgi:hypothetical protein
VAASPDGRRLLLAAGGEECLTGADPGAVLARWEALPGGQAGGSFSNDARWVIAHDESGAAAVRDAENGERRSVAGGRGAGAVAFTSGCRHVLTAGQDGTLRLWELGSGRQAACYSMPAAVAAVATRGRRVAIGDAAGNLSVLEMAGLDPGPPVVTVFRRRGELSFRCVGCGAESPALESWLGAETDCPRCAAAVALSRFVVTVHAGAGGKPTLPPTSPSGKTLDEILERLRGLFPPE